MIETRVSFLYIMQHARLRERDIMMGLLRYLYHFIFHDDEFLD
jgi:hypothetical protein